MGEIDHTIPKCSKEILLRYQIKSNKFVMILDPRFIFKMKMIYTILLVKCLMKTIKYIVINILKKFNSLKAHQLKTIKSSFRNEWI